MLSMDAVVVDAGSKLLKAGFAAPDQDPALVSKTLPNFIWVLRLCFKQNIVVYLFVR